MLTLPFRTMGALLVADDDTDPKRRWACAAVPRIARRADGTPRARLSTFTRAGEVASTDTRTAGRLSVDVDVRPTPEAIVAAGLDPAYVLPLPWLDAELEVQGPELDPVGAAIALALGTGGAVVDLDARATDVVAAALAAQTSGLLRLTWRGHVRARMPSIEVIATADIDEIRSRTTSLSVRGPTQVSIVTRSIVSASARIEIVGAADPALEASLREWACDALTEHVQSGKPLSIRATASDVTRMPIALTGMLEDSVRPDERAKLREDILLDPDDLLALRVFEVRPVGDVGGTIERVDVELEGAGTTARLELVEDRARRVTVPQGELQWRRRIVPRGGRAWPWSPWAPVGSTSGLAVPATLPANRIVEVVAAGFDFAGRWESIHVDIGSDGRPLTALVLEAATPSVRVDLGPATEAPVRARIVCLARSGYTHTRQVDAVEGEQLVVTDPFAGAVHELTLVPTGTGWADVAMTMVDLKRDEGGQLLRETVTLARLEDFVQWRVPATQDTAPTIAWRRHTSYRSGRLESTPWQTTTESVLPLPIAGVPRRTVQLLPIHIEPGMRIRARLSSGDVVREAAMSDRNAVNVELPPGRYRIALAWTMPDASERTLAERESDDDVVVIPRPAIP